MRYMMKDNAGFLAEFGGDVRSKVKTEGKIPNGVLNIPLWIVNDEWCVDDGSTTYFCDDKYVYFIAEKADRAFNVGQGPNMINGQTNWASDTEDVKTPSRGTNFYVDGTGSIGIGNPYAIYRLQVLS